MLYNKEEEVEQLERGFNVLLCEHGLSFQQACHRASISYPTAKGWFFRGRVHHDKLQTLIHSFAPDRFIQQRNGKLVIAKKL